MRNLRPARPTDLSSVVGIATSTGVFSPDEINCLDLDFLDFHESGNKDYMLVYEDEGVVQGFVHFGPLDITDRSWCLFWIAVSKEAQGRGIGKQMLEEVRKVFGDFRVKPRALFIETSSRVEYAATRAFYKCCGFSVAGVITNYYADGDSKVVFSKNI